MTLLSTKKEFENQTFKKESLVGLDLRHKVFSYVAFESCDFSQSDLTSSRFLECKFLGCNLSLIKTDGCRFQGADFENSKLVGVNFAKSDRMFLSLKFKNCLIGTSNFSDLDLKGTLFHKCVIRDTFFTQANLMSADFTESDLSGSTFHNTNLSKATFVGAINYAINPLTNKLTKAKFSKPEVLSLLEYLEIIIE
jgi:uncharacterized protein YjbI with pentapeptide repeats